MPSLDPNDLTVAYNRGFQDGTEDLMEMNSMTPNIPSPPSPPSVQLPQGRLTDQELQSLDAQRALAQQIVRQQGPLQSRATQQQLVSDPDPLIRILNTLNNKIDELGADNARLSGRLDATIDHVANLQAFVRGTLDFISDDEHCSDFMRQHMDRYLELLKENGLAPDNKKDEKSPSEHKREDIYNRLNNIG